MLRYATLALTIVLASCATPIGQFTEQDYDWIDVRADVGYQALYRRMLENFRRCGHAVPEGNVYTDNASAHLDVYGPGAYGGRSDWVVGVIDIHATADGQSAMRAGINRNLPDSRQESFKAQWRDWANEQPNDYSCRTAAR